MGEKQMISDTTVISQAESLVAVDMEGETVMLSIEKGKYYGMDPVGSKIWNLINESRSLSGLIELLVGEYEVEAEQCKNDVLKFLQYLVEEGLVKLK